MNYRELIDSSELFFETHQKYAKVDVFNLINVFSIGAEWMNEKLGELDSRHLKTFNKPLCFNCFGLFKYLLSLSGFIISFYFLWSINIILAPVSIFVFYFIEVHFLFLFPLLLNDVKNPIRTSIMMTYKIGIWRVVTTVMCIGFYMIMGCFKFKDQFRNWHIGCIAILIWYQDEIRNRL